MSKVRRLSSVKRIKVAGFQHKRKFEEVPVVGVPLIDPQQEQQKKKKPKRKTFKYVVFCDGNAKKNGQTGAIAGSGVFCPRKDVPNLSMAVPGRQTNNRAELFAMALALGATLDKKSVLIRADSAYTLNGIQKKSHMQNWKTNGWRTAAKKPVKNKDLWMLIDKLLTVRKSNSNLDSVQFEHVSSHTGVFGNEKADELATLGMVKPRHTKESLRLFPFPYQVELKEGNLIDIESKP